MSGLESDSTQAINFDGATFDEAQFEQMATTLTSVAVPSVSFGGTVTPPPISYSGSVTPPILHLDLSPTGPYKAAILSSTGSDSSTWQVAGTAPAPTPTPVPAPSTSWSSGVIYDLYGAPLRTDTQWPGWGGHEAPVGVNESWDWARGARPGQANPGSNVAFTSWGQAVEAETAWPVTSGGVPLGQNAGVRIQSRFWEVWTAASPTSPWTLLRTVSAEGGAAYDYVNFNGAGSENIRTDGTNEWSFPFVPGEIDHFWDNAWPRTHVPSSSSVFHIRAQIRLTTDTGVDLSKAKIVANISTDWYPTDGSTVSSAPAAGIGMPRFRFLLPAWQWFTYTGMTQAQMTANMPPVPVQPLS